MTKRNWIFFLILIGGCVSILIGLAIATNIDRFTETEQNTNYTTLTGEEGKGNKIDVEHTSTSSTSAYRDQSDDSVREWEKNRDMDVTGEDKTKGFQTASTSPESSSVKKKSSKKKSSKKTTKKTTTKKFTKEQKSTSTKSKVYNHEVAYSYLEQSFDSLGEYVSPQERTYRLQLVRSLDIQTIVIDCLSQKNGISQEFFKVVYLRKMIPAKILENVVESKEFRNLIPPEYLVREQALGMLKNGDYVVFKKTELKRLLDIWCNGQLTPVRKAWSVGAEK